MNVVPKERPWFVAATDDLADPNVQIGRVSGFLRRRFMLLMAGAFIAVVLAGFYLYTAVSSYESTIRIVLVEDRTKLLEEISGVQTEKNADEYIATQIGLIASENVARNVVSSLKLAQNEAFMYDRPTLIGTVKSWLAVDSRTAEGGVRETVDPESRAVERLRSALSVYRIDRSLIIELAYVSFDPQLTRDIANAYGEAYLSDQTQSHYAALSRASLWLEGRIEDLRRQSLDANREVEAFRAENDLIAANGRLVSEQNLLGMNSQMVLAEADYSRIGARLQVYEDAVNSGVVDNILGVLSTAPELAQSPSIQQLRADYVLANDRERAITDVWGPSDPQAVAVKAEKQRLSGLLIEEARRFVASYRNDLEAGRSQIRNLASNIRTASDKTENSNATLVTLSGLEQKAASYRTLYQSYLTRYQEALQQQSLAINTARIISQAQLPEEPILPKKKITMVLSLFLGLLAGAGVGVAMEIRDRTLRTYEDVNAMRLDFLGYLPRLPIPHRTARRGKGEISLTLYPEIKDALFIEALRSVKSASDIVQPRRGKVIGVVSLLLGEGKSVVTAGLAEMIAGDGQNVLLIDGNTQNPTLSTMAATPDAPNFLDILNGRATMADAVVTLASGAGFLPAPLRKPDSSPRSTTVLPLLSRYIVGWRSQYDVTLVELPAMSSTSDAKAACEHLDHVVFVIEWGRVDQSRFDYMLQSNPALRSKAIGALLTKVDIGRLRRYDPFY